MFDNIPRKDYERELEARARAEARADTLAEQNRQLTELLRGMILPRESPSQGFPVDDGDISTRPSYEEIMAMPAVGRRGVARRHHQAEEALKREQGEEKKSRQELSPTEEEEITRAISGNNHA
jgi:hypothetical protein